MATAAKTTAPGEIVPAGRSDSTRVPGALLLYHRPLRLIRDASTVREHIGAFGRYSRFPVTEVNTNFGFPRRLADLDFDAIVLHYSMFAGGPSPYLLDEEFRAWIVASDAYKIAVFQDEHHWCQRRFAFLDEHRIDCVFSCLEPEYFDQVYGRFTNVSKVVSYIPGHVSEDLLAAADRRRKPEDQRRIDVGYRGRPLPPRMGRGALEKTEIGRRFAELAADSGLVCDIDLSEEGRLYGEDWYRFVADCKGMLGVESGVSCFDLEDEVLAEEQRLIAAGEPVTIERLEQGALGRWDGNIPYRTISPRHFESAAFGVTQILFEGRYSGAMEPMRHYIPLKKDFSNFDQVLTRFRDPGVRKELTENARRDLIASGDYTYEGFIADFDRTLTEAGLEPATDQAALARRRSLRPPPRRTAFAYAEGVMGWLHLYHRRMYWAVHIVTLPITWPIRYLQLKFGREEAPTAPY